MINKQVIVRARFAGLFFGTLTNKTNNGDSVEVTLTKARKLWYWAGANAIEQLAVDGSCKPNDCKFTIIVDEVTIMDVIQIIPCTDKAINNINAIQEWKL